jgi:hypothetical protein
MRALCILLLCACAGGSDKGTDDWSPTSGTYEGIYSHVDPNECGQTQGFPVLELGLRITVDAPDVTVQHTNAGGQVDGPAMHCSLDEDHSFDCISAAEEEDVSGFDAITTADIGVIGSFTEADRLSGHVYIVYGCTGSDCETIKASSCTSLVHYQGILT